MDRDLRRFWTASFVALFAAVIVSTGRASDGFVNWLERFQTLIAGAGAVGAAVATIWWMRKIDDNRLVREQYAARAVLPLALSVIVDYASQCVDYLEPLLARAPSNADLVEIPKAAPPVIPETAIATLRDAVQYSARGHSRQLANLLSHLQVQRSRLQRSRGEKEWTSHTVQSRILDAAVLYAMADQFFDYGRRTEEGEWRPDVTYRQVVHALINLRIWEQYKGLDELVRLYYPGSEEPEGR